MDSYEALKTYREQQKRKQDEARELFNSQRGLSIFWMGLGEEGLVFIYDDPGVIFAYHRIGTGKQSQFYGCAARKLILLGTDEAFEKAKRYCHFCHAEQKLIVGPGHTAFKYRPSVDKKGNKRLGYKTLLTPINNVYDYLMKKSVEFAAQGKTLAGTIYEVSRTTDQRSPSQGSNWEYKGRGSLAAIAAKYGLSSDDITPYDYNAILKAPKPEVAAKIVSSLKLFEQDTEEIIVTE